MALPDRKMPDNGGSLICYHTGTWSPLNLDKVKSWLELHPNHFKPSPQLQMNSYSHFQKLGIEQYNQLLHCKAGKERTLHPHFFPAPLAFDSEPFNATGWKRPALGLAKITLNNMKQR